MSEDPLAFDGWPWEQMDGWDRMVLASALAKATWRDRLRWRWQRIATTRSRTRA